MIHKDIGDNTVSSNDLGKWGLAINANGQVVLKVRPYHIVTYSVSQVAGICV